VCVCVRVCGAETVGGPFRAGGVKVECGRGRGQGCGCGCGCGFRDGGGACSSSVGSMPGGGVEAIHAIDAMEPTEPTDANEAIEPILAGHAASVGWATL
jgi:hypothetical protein